MLPATPSWSTPGERLRRTAPSQWAAGRSASEHAASYALTRLGQLRPRLRRQRLGSTRLDSAGRPGSSSGSVPRGVPQPMAGPRLMKNSSRVRADRDSRSAGLPAGAERQCEGGCAARAWYDGYRIASWSRPAPNRNDAWTTRPPDRLQVRFGPGTPSPRSRIPPVNQETPWSATAGSIWRPHPDLWTHQVRATGHLHGRQCRHPQPYPRSEAEVSEASRRMLATSGSTLRPRPSPTHLQPPPPPPTSNFASRWSWDWLGLAVGNGRGSWEFAVAHRPHRPAHREPLACGSRGAAPGRAARSHASSGDRSGRSVPCK